jgi:hypothetical protein
MHTLVSLGLITLAFSVPAVLFLMRPVSPDRKIPERFTAAVIPSAQLAKVLREQNPAPRDHVAEHARKVTGQGARVALLRHVDAVVEKQVVPTRQVSNLAVKPFCPSCLEQHSEFRTYPACPPLVIQ